MYFAGDRCIAEYFQQSISTVFRLDGNSVKFYRRPLPGIEGNFSNHSGKKTCATQLCIAEMDKQDQDTVVRKQIQKDIVGSKVSVVLDLSQPQQREKQQEKSR